jgi:phage shock protein PspC (stress-responsive transcriptional regulator)
MAEFGSAGHDRGMDENTMYESADTPPAQTPGPRRLTRTRDGRMITGVCSGIAAYLKVDPTLVRIGVAVLTVLTTGAGILLYAAAALIIPEEGKDASIVQELIDKQVRRGE